MVLRSENATTRKGAVHLRPIQDTFLTDITVTFDHLKRTTRDARHGNNRRFVNSQHGREILAETAAAIRAKEVRWRTWVKVTIRVGPVLVSLLYRTKNNREYESREIKAACNDTVHP